MKPSARKYEGEFGVDSYPTKRVCLQSCAASAGQPSDDEPAVVFAVESFSEQTLAPPTVETPLLPIPTPPHDQKSICYGALFEVQAAVNTIRRISHCRELVQTRNPMQQYKIVNNNDGYFLLSAHHGNFAVIDSITTKFLSELQSIPDIGLVAVVDSNKLNQTKINRRKLSVIPLSINIYGHIQFADTVGEALGKAGSFLQHPAFLEPSIEYYNPQFYYPDGKLEPLTHLVGLSDSDISAKHLSEEVETVLASLDTHGKDATSATDADLTSIAAGLEQHQKFALDFMRRHEDMDEIRAIRRDLSHVIGLPRSDMIPTFCSGGILADVMGLGKTLSILALIASTMQSANDYQPWQSTELQERGSISGVYTKATLVVVTSAQVLDSWTTEIQRHSRPNALKVLVFHGDKRPRSMELVVDHDIVLTTYATLVADCKSANILTTIEWFRVVLDEAHWIRNQRSQQFRAVEKVSSQRRWCVTGTPIQNRIDDLRSLLRFLRFEPLCNGDTFQKYIIEPLSKDDTHRTKALHVLLRGVCLRRDESYLKLPDPVHQVVATCFDAREKELYDGVLKICQRDLDDVVSGQSKAKKYAALFAAIMKLRRLCNHGTLLASESVSNSDPTTPGMLESSCEYCQGNQEENLAALNEDTVCPECGRSLQRVQVPGPLAPEFGASRTSTPDAFFGVEQLRGKSPMIQLTDGTSSKLSRVVETLRQTNREGKSLVFSYWTSTLDLLKQMLWREQIPCLTIDGRVPYKERPGILEQFRTDERVPILLMSIQTGAVGLNLTAANFVHIVEPQWNPSVEEQAIGRALRMGQTRTVTVFRYVMQSSIEQNIQTLQKKKRNLAKFTLDGSGTESGTLEDFKFMLDM